jgi:uncharacterized protein (DUF2062 family)
MSRLRQWRHALLQQQGTPHQTSLAFAIGVFIAFFPVLGIHTAIALLVAFYFRLSKVALLAGCWLNNPWTIAPMLSGGTLLGCALLGMPLSDLRAIEWELSGWAFYSSLWRSLRPYLLPFVVGNLFLGVLSGALAYLALRLVLERRRQPVAQDR